MSFVVDGAEWQLDGLTNEEIVARFERLLEFVAISVERAEDVLVGDEYQSQPMRGAATLWELEMLPQEVVHELSAWLGRSPYYAKAAKWPDGMDQTSIRIGDELEVDNVDVAWVHHAVRGGADLACFSLNRKGNIPTVSSLGAANVYFTGDEASRLAFWRHVVRTASQDAENLERYAVHAYPDLYFAQDVLRGVDRLAGGYIASSDRVQNSLATLNDIGRWVFTCPPPALTRQDTADQTQRAAPTNQLIQSRFGAAGVNAAPENPNVKLERACREAREILIRGRTLYCGWHVKLEQHRNRIHFHGPVNESDDRIVVGIIHEHLPLP